MVQGQILNAFQNNVPVQNSLKDLFKALFQSGALDDQFNALWQNQGETLATSKINAAVLEAEPNAYNIQPNYPKTGALSASIELQVNAPGITQQWPSGTQGSQLDLTFSLKGVSATFNTTTGFGTFGAPEWKTTFDADLDVLIGVPTDPTIPLVGFLISDDLQYAERARELWWPSRWIHNSRRTMDLEYRSGHRQLVCAATFRSGSDPAVPGRAGTRNVHPTIPARAPSVSPGGAVFLSVEYDSGGLQEARCDHRRKPTVELGCGEHGGDNPDAPRRSRAHYYQCAGAACAGPTFTSPEIGASSTQVNAGGLLIVSGDIFQRRRPGY